MATGSARYRGHKVWETLQLKLEALKAARYDDVTLEKWRNDVIEWLSEAAKTKLTQQPALYLSSLDELSQALNELQTGNAEFKRYVGTPRQPQNSQVWRLEAALRSLPLPPPKELKDTYVALLDREIEVRTARLDELQERVLETESSLQSRRSELEEVSSQLGELQTSIETARTTIAEVSEAAERKIATEWHESLSSWERERASTVEGHDEQALHHIATLAATAQAGNALAEHAAGDLSATDWKGRAKRERRAAQWMRAGAGGAFLIAAAVGFFIVKEAIRNNFDLTLGDGVLRSSLALIVGAFGALLLRESGRHFREADTAEDVALSLQALAPFYAGSDDSVRLDARAAVGDAVLVKNVLSRFAHRDAAKHSAEVNTADLPKLVEDATKALRGGQNLSQS